MVPLEPVECIQTNAGNAPFGQLSREAVVTRRHRGCTGKLSLYTFKHFKGGKWYIGMVAGGVIVVSSTCLL